MGIAAYHRPREICYNLRTRTFLEGAEHGFAGPARGILARENKRSRISPYHWGKYPVAECGLEKDIRMRVRSEGGEQHGSND